MNKLNILKALKNNRLRICMAFALALMMALLPAFNINTLTEIMVLAEEYGETYEGETTANVRVRSGAGTDNSVLFFRSLFFISSKFQNMFCIFIRDIQLR